MKTTVRFHYTLTTVTKLYKINIPSAGRAVEEQGRLTHCCQE